MGSVLCGVFSGCWGICCCFVTEKALTGAMTGVPGILSVEDAGAISGKSLAAVVPTPKLWVDESVRVRLIVFVCCAFTGNDCEKPFFKTGVFLWWWFSTIVLISFFNRNSWSFKAFKLMTVFWPVTACRVVSRILTNALLISFRAFSAVWPTAIASLNAITGGWVVLSARFIWASIVIVTAPSGRGGAALPEGNTCAWLLMSPWVFLGFCWELSAAIVLLSVRGMSDHFELENQIKNTGLPNQWSTDMGKT